MANGPPYVVEFLFRGRDAADETGLPATYHVILGRWVDTIDNGRKLETGRTLRPAQAAALGFPLTALTGAIAAQAMIDKDAADAASAAATAAKDAANEAKAVAEAARDSAVQAKAAAEANLASTQAALGTSQAALAATQALLETCTQQSAALADQVVQANAQAVEAVRQRDIAVALAEAAEAKAAPPAEEVALESDT